MNSHDILVSNAQREGSRSTAREASRRASEAAGRCFGFWSQLPSPVELDNQRRPAATPRN
jgi:hypothetical protein